MALSPKPDPLGQSQQATAYEQGVVPVDQDGGVSQGIDTAAGSGYSAGAGDVDASAAESQGGGLDAIGSLISRGQQVAGFVQNPLSLVNAAVDKIKNGVPALGKIAGIVGGVDDLIGIFRSGNIPGGAETAFSRGSTAAYVEVKQGFEEDWRIRIDCNFDLFNGAFPRLSATGGLVWPYLPNITFVSRANYSAVDPIHNNQPFQAYKNSQVEDIQIAGDFSVENEADAEYWIQATTFLRTATKMFFGQGAYVGNPPVICNLTGYGSRVFNNVPVVIKSFSIDFKEDVNYMRYQSPTDASPTWVPVLSTISVTVAPVYNRTRLRKFNLQDFAKGKAVGHL